jgi:hypothetical protein
MVREWQAGQGDEFAAAVETAKTLAETNHFQTVLKNGGSSGRNRDTVWSMTASSSVRSQFSIYCDLLP